MFANMLTFLYKPTAVCVTREGAKELTLFMPLILFDIPWKHQKTSSFNYNSNSSFRSSHDTLEAWKPATLLKKTPAQEFSC